MSRKAVSAIVVTYHTGPHLKECLYALKADRDVDQIVIVDNGNPTDMEGWVTTFVADSPSARLIRGHGNVGFGAGVNLGAHHADGDDYLIINPDAVLRLGSVSALQAVARELPIPSIVGGKIFDLFGAEERGPRRRELTLFRAVTTMLGWNTWTLERSRPPDQAVDMDVISGAFFLMSRLSFNRLSGFDESYFLHVEDVDLCRRCREAGGRVVYHPGASALHYRSTSDAPNRIVAGHKADSLERYFKKFSRTSLERMLIAVAMPIMRSVMRLKAR